MPGDHTDANWVLHAIENAAMARAQARILGNDEATFMGLTVKQVVFLVTDYETRTGLKARDIGEA